MTGCDGRRAETILNRRRVEVQRICNERLLFSEEFNLTRAEVGLKQGGFVKVTPGHRQTLKQQINISCRANSTTEENNNA